MDALRNWFRKSKPQMIASCDDPNTGVVYITNIHDVYVGFLGDVKTYPHVETIIYHDGNDYAYYRYLDEDVFQVPVPRLGGKSKTSDSSNY